MMLANEPISPLERGLGAGESLFTRDKGGWLTINGVNKLPRVPSGVNPFLCSGGYLSALHTITRIDCSLDDLDGEARRLDLRDLDSGEGMIGRRGDQDFSR